jgi:hypothetical protein
MNTKITTPVLLLVFNKPEKTKQVFDVIGQVKPTKLYVAADAPRVGNQNDIGLCQQVRDIVKNVDWECEIHYLFHEKNVGLALGGKLAWDWIFSQEEEMIFLEDDGVASLSFFGYCQEMLERYKFDKRIALIGGVNYGVCNGDASYFFTRSGSGTYGMATWKRVYDLYEFELESFDQTINKKDFKASFVNNLSYQIRKASFLKFDTYDIQFIYLLHKYDMWCIVPNVNMVTDIGYDYDATNNLGAPDSPTAKKYGNRPRFEIEKIMHPDEFSIDKKFEKIYYQKRYFQGKSWLNAWLNFYAKPRLLSIPFIYPIFKMLKKMIKKQAT